MLLKDVYDTLVDIAAQQLNWMFKCQYSIQKYERETWQLPAYIHLTRSLTE